MKYSGFLRRFVAFFLDIVIFVFIFIAVAIPLSISQDSGKTLLSSILLKDMSVFAIILGWLYYAFMESSNYQATIGKLILKMKVVDINGQRIDFMHATLRYFAKYISSFFLLLGYFFALFTKRKQALHDLIAGCVIIDIF